MARFIKLHNRNDNSTVIVNVDDITLIDACDENGRMSSSVYLKTMGYITEGNQKSFRVNETPEKIFNMLEKLSGTPEE